MSKIIELSEQERNLVDRFFTECPHLVRKYAGEDNQYLGDIWEAICRAVRSYKPENGDFVNYAAVCMGNAKYKAYKNETIFIHKKDKGSDSGTKASSSDDAKEGKIISIIPFKDDDPDSGGSALAPVPSSPEDDIEYCEIVKIIEECLPSRDSQIVCLLCSRIYDSGDC